MPKHPLRMRHPARVDDASSAQVPSAFPRRSNRSRPADAPGRAGWVWAVCGFLLLAVGLVFGQTVSHEFIGFDDSGFVYENPHVTAGLTPRGIWWALTDGPYGEWTPLSTLSDMLDCQLYGVKPAGHYLTNVLLHAASSVLLFLVLLRMTGERWPSAWVAAVFAIHPLHVESVAWVAERRDVMSGLFFMVSLGAYAIYVERPSLARYLAVAGCFALGLMAKSMLVTVPFLLLLLDYWPLDRFRPSASPRSPIAAGSWFARLPAAWRLVVEKIPLMALAAVSCTIVLSTHSTTQSTNPIARLSLVTRLAHALVSYATYLRQSFYPVDLVPYYPYPDTQPPLASAAAALVLLAAVTGVAAYESRRRPYLLVGWLWFLGMLVPVIGLMQIGAIARADRFTYLSQIGLSIALAWSVWAFYRSRTSWQAVSWGRRPWLRWALAAVSAGAVLTLAALAWRQTSYWRNAEALWSHSVASSEQNLMAHYNLAFVYNRQGRTEEAITVLRAASQADSIDPQLLEESQGLLADCLTRQGKTEEALTHYEQAVRAFPRSPIAHDRLAAAFARAGKHDRAVAEWRETVRLAPAYLQPRLGMANALLAQRDAGQAIVECREVLKHQPDSTEALVLLGLGLGIEGDLDDALVQLERAVKLDPRSARAHFVLGLTLDDLNRPQLAMTHLNEAIRLQPDDLGILRQTAWILATCPDASVRDAARAIELATRANQLSGGQDPRVADTLSAALAEAGQFPAAVEAADRASALALARGDAALVDAIDQRARLYRQGLPYRQPASLPPTAR